MAGRRVPDAIEFAACASSIGEVVVAHGSDGIRAVFLGDDGAAVLLALRSRFALGTLTPDQGSCKRVLPDVLGLIEAPWKGFALSVDARGTPRPLRGGSTSVVRGGENQAMVGAKSLPRPSSSNRIPLPSSKTSGCRMTWPPRCAASKPCRRRGSSRTQRAGTGSLPTPCA